MGDDLVTDAILRQFLLGQLSEEERQQVERRFITDSQTRERILLVEQDLIEDYLEASLTAAEREQFLQQYAATPEQRRKLRITKAIKDRAAQERSPRTVPATASAWTRLRERLRPRLLLVVPIAAALIIAIVTAVIWLNRRVERQTQRLTIAKEVTDLNAPSNRQVAGTATSLELLPGARRSVESPPQLVKRDDVTVVELRLTWLHEEYRSYRVAVQRVGEGELVSINGFRAEGKVIGLRLPAHMLTRGTYLVELTGLNDDGSTGPAEEYQFTVTDKTTAQLGFVSKVRTHIGMWSVPPAVAGGSGLTFRSR